MKYFNPITDKRVYLETCKYLEFQFSHWEHWNSRPGSQIIGLNSLGAVPSLEIMGTKVGVMGVNAENEPFMRIEAENLVQLTKALTCLQEETKCRFEEFKHGE